ncbi:MAG: HlyD family secretion protein [Acidiferrobacterales bacterium]
MRPEHSIVRYWLLILFLLLILPGCSKPWGGSGDDSPIQLSGTVEARDADLSFQVGGRIATMPVNEGAAVKKGDVVATLDDSDYKLGLQRAQAEYAAARATVVQAKARLKLTTSELNRLTPLADKDLVSPQQIEQAQTSNESAAADLQRANAQVKVTAAALNTAQHQLNYVRLTAPNDGIISSRLAEIGEVVPAGKPVFSLAETSRPWIRAYINETDLARVRIGQEAEVRVDGLPDKVFKGRLSFISPKAEFTPKTVETQALRVDLVYRVRVEVDNPDGILKIGMPADIKLLPAE